MPDTPSTPSGAASPPPANANPAGRRKRRFLLRWGIPLGVIVLLLIGGLVLAEHETAKPEFCGSCHIMKPYYQSWQADLHGGNLEVACVDCHYAPGEKTTVKAKMRGLSQLMSYFSGRYGATRPRAFVDNQSCMTSKCHGDSNFMTKELTMGTVKFVHAKHLQFDQQKVAATNKELDELSKAIQAAIGQEQFTALETIAGEAIHADERLAQMTKVVNKSKETVTSDKLARFSQLHHQQIRVDQLANLQCTNCHSYGESLRAVPGQEKAHHFSVKTSSCITCHFANESFNTGTTTCLKCHTLPTKQILVHEELSPEKSGKLKEPEMAKKPVSIDHATMIERKVSCYSCHADVALSRTAVTLRDCAHCHDRPEYFADWKEPLSLKEVGHYHEAHVRGQKAKCLDCHSEIQHQLVRKDTPLGQPFFLASAISNCTGCHPNQHAAQVHLLTGTGGEGVPKGNPNLMFGARTNCFGCHQEDFDKKHQGVKGATPSGCISCHGNTKDATYEKWKVAVKTMQMDADEAYEKANKLFETAKDLDAETSKKASALLKGIQADFQLVKRGNAVHNVTYSMDLLDSVTSRCQQVITSINKAKKNNAAKSTEPAKK